MPSAHDASYKLLFSAPELVRDLVPPGAAELTAVSKYCLCYEKTAYLRGFNYWESDFENRGDI